MPGISGVDTRFLTRKQRDGGTLKAAIRSLRLKELKYRSLQAHLSQAERRKPL